MIIKLLGLLDILAAVFFWLFAVFHILPSSIVMLLSLIILIKGLIFLINEHFASIVDVAVAGIMLLSLGFNIHPMLASVVTLIMLQKGIFSLL